VETVQYVMDILYQGGGTLAGDTAEYAKVVEMLQIQTVMIDELVAKEGFTKEEFKPATAVVEEAGLSNFDEKRPEKNEEDIKKKVEVLEVGGDKDKEKLKPPLKRGRRNVRSNNSKDVGSAEREENIAPENGNESQQKSDVVTNAIKKPSDKLSELVEKYAGKTPSVSELNKADGVQSGLKQSNRDDRKENSSAKENIEIVIDDDDIEQIDTVDHAGNGNERYCCPFKDCKSESKTSQSIKVHLALVHYKKTIQSDFPNWKRQKCDQCDKSFGQMTAYYLHMANHKRYPFMDLPGDALKVNKDIDNIKTSPGNMGGGGILTQSRTKTPIPSTGITSLPPPGPLTPKGAGFTGNKSKTIQSSQGSSGPSFGRSNSFVQSQPVVGGNGSTGSSMSRSKSFVHQPLSSPASSKGNSSRSPTRTQPNSLRKGGGGSNFGSDLSNLISSQKSPFGLKPTPLGNSQSSFSRPNPPGPPGGSKGPPGPSLMNMKKNGNKRSTSPPGVKEGKKFRGF